MKCGACNFEQRGEDLPQIQVLGAAPMAGILESLAIVSERGIRSHVDLFACPKCGTIRMEKSQEKTRAAPA